MKYPLAAAVSLFALAPSVMAGPLTEARVNKIINEVEVVDSQSGAHAAKLNDVINERTSVKTGIKSRSELLFQDNTLTRIGPESFFSFTPGTRDMELKEGTMLLQVPKGLGGAKIHTAAVTAAITGTTIMIEHRPGKDLKVLVLEGSLRLSVNGTFGDSLLLTPGKMVIMAPNAKRIPDPVSVDLAHIVKTSSLVKMGKSASASLPSMALIEKEIATQVQDKTVQRLIDTNLVIDGAGTNVTLAKLDRAASAVNPVANPAPTSAPLPTPAPARPPDPTPLPVSTPPTATPAPTVAPLPSTTPRPSPVPGPTSRPSPTVRPRPSATPRPTIVPAPSATPAPTPGGGGDDDDDQGNGDEHFDDVVDLSPHGGSGNVTITTPINLSTNGHSGKVQVHAPGTITVNTVVEVSASGFPRPSVKGGKIDLKSDKLTGTAISVTSSAQLLSLLNAAMPGPGGSIRFTSAGGAINLSGAKLQADRGTIDLRNDGDNGQIALSGSTLRANIVKIRALGPNGRLTIGGGTISADTLISLLSEGSNGTVIFTDNVTLSGNSAKTISGNTVTVVNGKIVNISGPGPASVFTNHANYTGSGGNGSTTGRFGGSGATTALFTTGPGH